MHDKKSHFFLLTAATAQMISNNSSHLKKKNDTRFNIGVYEWLNKNNLHVLDHIQGKVY